MGEHLSDVAGRVVDTLSRRRFLRWLGAGGVTLAAGFGLDRSRAYAGPNCSAVRCAKEIQMGETIFAQEKCIPKGLVSTTCHLDGTFKAACLNECQTACQGSDDCRPQKCTPKLSSADNVVEKCTNLGQSDCPQGQIKCRCEVQVRGGFDKGTLVCGCFCQ